MRAIPSAEPAQAHNLVPETIMAAEAAGRGRTVSIWVLRVVLGVTFLAIGAAKLTGAAQTVQLFAAIGWGQWFRYLTGLLDVAGAALLFAPRWTCYGALLLTCTVGSATMFYLVLLRHNPAAPLALTLLAATLAWVTRPRRVN
jgi:putative oxidoreductase